ncbi:glycogen synthase GlgA [Alysiella filiformis]|uniref:Glycogen synthase n=1 Tax=Alysiella filiformis DSM 16848 TaxID=1120981 RepID=A0A286E9B8_9NEIS|nr:glycogen synthase GlgA [Alysiella filiformis]QMT31428.1 glycogen synthase GlgA [Alysiella filiformis]UBQ55563.1 glycogen synthase GlgA [Alysiella filiformis DSM 16848]SOD67508.1 starch synthase [Alysiella filiformis DSM 16848]
MKILHATSELYPLIKTGGLADVLGALPLAQQQNGDDVRVVLPYYHDVRQKLPFTAEVARRDTFGGYVVIRYAEFQGIGLYLIDAPHLYDRHGNPYHNEFYQDYADNVIRFGILGWAAAAIATGIDPLWGKADVLHAHDWQAGLAPAYLTAWHRRDVKSVFTIHNIAYQGCFYPHHWRDLWLPEWVLQAEGAEFYGQLSFLKSGLYYADHITTVSPSYAHEITGDLGSYGMGGLLRHRQMQGKLSGILNGVDAQIWNPISDPNIPQNYDLQQFHLKSNNKLALQKHFGLNENAANLLTVMVSRLTEQKGADLLWASLHRLLPENPHLQFALLGSGSPELERAFNDLAQQYPQQVGVHIGYDEKLAHRLVGGGDVIAVPSRFEPCGLTQLYGLKYGTLPLVRKTGGLADTVAHGETGFVFEHANVDDLSACFQAALNTWQNKALWSKYCANAMQQDYGWQRAAQAYRAIYA